MNTAHQPLSCYVKVSVANLHRDPTFRSEVVTQALMGERLEVVESWEEWDRVRQWDGYEAWFCSAFFAAETSNRFVAMEAEGKVMEVADLHGSARTEPSASSEIVRDTVFANRMGILHHRDGWTGVLLPDDQEAWTCASIAPPGAVPTREKIVETASKFLGVPYQWGGKTPRGFDCSGFIQTVMRSAGIALPRDAYLQESAEGLVPIGLEEAMPGDLIFFQSSGEKTNHVAISLGGRSIIHCSGMVRRDTLDPSLPACNLRLATTVATVQSIREMCREGN